MSFFKWGIFLFVIAFLMIGAKVAEMDNESNITRDIYNYTESIINITRPTITSNYPIDNPDGAVINMGRVTRIIQALVNFMIEVSEQTVKMGIEYGYEHPNINYELLFKYLIIIMVLYIVMLLIKPVFYILIFLVMVIIFIIEWFKKRKKRRKHGTKRRIN